VEWMRRHCRLRNSLRAELRIEDWRSATGVFLVCSVCVGYPASFFGMTISVISCFPFFFLSGIITSLFSLHWCYSGIRSFSHHLLVYCLGVPGGHVFYSVFLPSISTGVFLFKFWLQVSFPSSFGAVGFYYGRFNHALSLHKSATWYLRVNESLVGIFMSPQLLPSDIP
jgi:hypothetical protein